MLLRTGEAIGRNVKIGMDLIWNHSYAIVRTNAGNRQQFPVDHDFPPDRRHCRIINRTDGSAAIG